MSPAPTDKSNNYASASYSLWLYHQGWPGEIMLSGNHSCNRKIGAVNSVLRGCALLVMAFMGWTEPALARSYLNCPTKKVVIVDAPRGSIRPASKSTWNSGLMRRRKPSCLPMARRLQSIGSKTGGLAPLVATCPTSSTVKPAI